MKYPSHFETDPDDLPADDDDDQADGDDSDDDPPYLG